jgi:anti-sigma-K factor RskA
MRCEEVEELAGAYALHALPPDEMADVDRHLAGCRKHPEVADLVATALRLSALAPEMEPPPALKTRLMDAVREDLAAERAAVPARRPDGQERGWLSRLFGSPRLGYALAGALALVVAALLLTRSGGDGGDDTVVRDIQGTGITGEVIYIPDEQTAVMNVEGLDPPPEGQAYQVWAITGGNPVSIGFLDVPDEGPSSSAMNVQIVEGQTVAVTLEPEGGSPLPTTQPVLSADF